MLKPDDSLYCIEAEDSEILEVLRSDKALTLPEAGADPVEVFVVAVARGGRSEVYSATYGGSKRSVKVFRLPVTEAPAAGYRGMLKQVISYWEGLGFKLQPVKINYAKAMREVVIRGIPVIMSPLALRKMLDERNRSQSKLTRKDHAASSGEKVSTGAAEGVPPATICEAEEVANQEDADARKRAEAAARKEAEEAARKQAEEAARKEAEAAARMQAEAAARMQAEAAARMQAEAAARKQAETAARKKAEDAARIQAETAARKQAEAAARTQAETAARKKAEDTARKEAEEAARKQAEKSPREQAEVAALEKSEAIARSMAREAEWKEAESERRKAEEAVRRLSPEERAALVIEKETRAAKARVMVDEAAALLVGGGSVGGGQEGAQGNPVEIFSLVPGLESLVYGDPAEVAELYTSLSMVVLSLENYSQQHCSAYICALHRQGKVEIYVVLRLKQSQCALFYAPRHQPANMNEYRQKVGAALRFLEVTGFLVDPTPLGATPEERKKSLALLPFLKARGS